MACVRIFKQLPTRRTTIRGILHSDQPATCLNCFIVHTEKTIRTAEIEASCENQDLGDVRLNRNGSHRASEGRELGPRRPKLSEGSFAKLSKRISEKNYSYCSIFPDTSR